MGAVFDGFIKHSGRFQFAVELLGAFEQRIFVQRHVRSTAKQRTQGVISGSAQLKYMPGVLNRPGQQLQTDRLFEIEPFQEIQLLIERGAITFGQALRPGEDLIAVAVSEIP